MSDTTAAAHEIFEHEEKAVRKRVNRFRTIQNLIWISCLAAGGIFFGWIAMAHHQNGIPLEELAVTALPILMWGTIAITAAYVVFVMIYFGIVRAIYHSQSVVHPRLNDQLHPDEHRQFNWHSYFRKNHNREARRIDAVLVITMKVTKLVSMFALIGFGQFAWMYLMDLTGQELMDEHYSFLGLVDLTLFSCLVLYVVVLLAIRVGALGKRGKEHKWAKEHHPASDPNRAR
ncbi:hypothetical protein MMIC_P0046 [Mariprofundus micogutta]|uniref:Uncharacterized protein n=1 Tax=Mariprofundus micogutta TaxID=1921010 RepID=A0A1L8CJM2_9PROT|nr:hypothetical protein [Mariprofundus micogutta]GAV19117.1 hypothetical protein MMIC_P0046 [Mariprofundus micogutta]